MNLFKKDKSVPATYRPVAEAPEVIDFFTRLTLHQQAALLRLIGRNVIVKTNVEQMMGYEFEYEVDGAMILMKESNPQAELIES